jgi:hypothetical protein
MMIRISLAVASLALVAAATPSFATGHDSYAAVAQHQYGASATASTQSRPAYTGDTSRVAGGYGRRCRYCY